MSLTPTIQTQTQDSANLFQLVSEGNLENLTDRLYSEDKNVDVNSKDGLGRTLLHLAVLCEQAQIVELLLSKGAILTEKLRDGCTALHIAVSKGNQDLVTLLLEEKAKRDELSRDTIDEDIARDISSLSLDVEKDSTTQERPGQPQRGRQPILTDLVNARMQNPQYTPLHIAILNGDVAMIRLLVSSFKADVKLDANGFSSLFLALQLPGPEAKETFQTLLELGASTAQQLRDQPSTFHQIVLFQDEDILNLVTQYDQAGLNQVLNQVHHQFSQPSTPLTAAIAANNEQVALKLLEMGATPYTTYETFMQNAPQNPTQRVEHEDFLRKNFKHTFQQPIVLAAQMEMVNLVRALLSKGADPSTLTKESNRLVSDPVMYSLDRGETVVDIVHEKIKTLRGDHSERSEVWANKRNDLAEKKKRAIEVLAEKFESLEDKLAARGGHFFRELYPDITFQPQRAHVPRSMKPSRFQIKEQTFEGNDEKYHILYKLAAEGDEKGIKKLTLDTWGPDHSNPPLQIAVQNTARESPFSTAVVHGHMNLARTIAQIAEIQYSGPQSDSLTQSKTQAISKLTSPSFPAEKLNNLATIVQSPISAATMITGQGDIISAHFIHHQADPKLVTQPLFDILLQYSENQAHFITHNSNNFESCVETGNISVLKQLIIHTGAPFKHHIRPNAGGTPELEVRTELEPKHARIPLLEAAYKGNLESVKWLTDIEDVLSCYREFAETHEHDTRKQTLEQGRDRFMAKVKTWLTTRTYLVLHCAMMSYPMYIGEYITVKESDDEKAKAEKEKRRREKEASEEKLATLISYILSSPSLNASVNSPSADGFTPLHLAVIRRIPPSTIYMLLVAGADISASDELGRNVLHLLLAPVGEGGHSHPILNTDLYVSEGKVEELLAMLETNLASRSQSSANSTKPREPLWKASCDEAPGSLTPLARYLIAVSALHVHGSSYLVSAIPVLRSILAYSTGEELSVRDGKGDEVLHFLARHGMGLLVPVILEKVREKKGKQDQNQLTHLTIHPLNRENATGKTPLELAREMWWRKAGEGLTMPRGRSGLGMGSLTIVDKPPEWFDDEYWKTIDESRRGPMEKEYRTWRVFQEAEIKGTTRVLTAVEHGAGGQEGKQKKGSSKSAKGTKDSKKERTARGKGKDEISLWVYRPGYLY